jgi:hypothetical protein
MIVGYAQKIKPCLAAFSVIVTGEARVMSSGVSRSMSRFWRLDENGVMIAVRQRQLPGDATSWFMGSLVHPQLECDLRWSSW